MRQNSLESRHRALKRGDVQRPLIDRRLAAALEAGDFVTAWVVDQACSVYVERVRAFPASLDCEEHTGTFLQNFLSDR